MWAKPALSVFPTQLLSRNECNNDDSDTWQWWSKHCFHWYFMFYVIGLLFSEKSTMFSVCVKFVALFFHVHKHTGKRRIWQNNDDKNCKHWQALFYLQSDSNGMLWPGWGQAQLCPKVLTEADELINVNHCDLHPGSSAQLWNGWKLRLPNCKVWKLHEKIIWYILF